MKNMRNDGPEGEGVADHFDCNTEENAADAPQETEANRESNAALRGALQRLHHVTNEQKAELTTTARTSTDAGHVMNAVATGIMNSPTQEYTSLLVNVTAAVVAAQAKAVLSAE
jgi:hypothetical protein